MALICGFAAIFGAAAPAGAATESFGLSSAAVSGQSSVTWQGPPVTPPGTPNAFPDATNPITLNGQIDPSTGDITGASLSLPPIPQPEQEGAYPVFTFSEVDPGTATGNFNATTGAVTLNDSLTLTFTTTGIADITCVSTPIDVALSGTWDSTTEDVTLSASGFTIPNFVPGSPSCADASPSLNASPGGTAGAVGNAMSLALNGQFAPGLPTTTTLATSPSTSPQPAGTSVTLTATVVDPSAAGTPTGNVNFQDNGQSIGVETLSASGTTGTATASLTTTTLPQLPNQQQLVAIYSGDTSYAGSTSNTVSYTIQAKPTISSTFPSQMTAGLTSFPTPTQFTVTVADPAGGASYSNVFLYVNLQSEGLKAAQFELQYEDPSGNWCPLTLATGKSPPGSLGTGAATYFGGTGTAPCGFGSSFSLDPGTSTTFNMEVSINQAPYSSQPTTGIMAFQTALETGTCTSGTSCSAVAPLDGSAAVTSQTPSTVLPPNGVGTVPSQVTSSTEGGTWLSNYDVVVQATVSATSAAKTDYYLTGQTPTGTVQYSIDGQYAATYTLSSAATDSNSYYPGILTPGTHTIVAIYSGDLVFAPSTTSGTFTIVAGPPTGTLYVCAGGTTNPGTWNAYVTATGVGVPTAAASGSTVNVSGLSVTLNLDPQASYAGNVTAAKAATAFNSGQSGDAITLSPGSAATQPGTATFAADPTTDTQAIGTWSGLSTAVTVNGSPGSTVPIGVGSISFTFNTEFGYSVDCTPTAQPATIGTVTISGTTLAVSPSGSALAGAPVTMTATVAPLPSTSTNGGSSYKTPAPGQVDFYDGSTYLGTANVAASGAAAATASLTTSTLPVGDHQLTAIWSGYSGVPGSTSNTVDYAVGTATTTSLASSANPANAANPVTFTATVSPPLGALTQPTGDVSFTSDGSPISGCSNQPLSMASPPMATCTTSFGAGQSHSIVATYSGDGTYLGSASDPLTQTTLAGTNTTILSTKDPSPAGNVTFWAGVSPSAGTGATPTGTVAFTIDGKVYSPCATQPLGAGGGASCTVSFKAGTSHKVSATYPGSASYSGSTSNTITQTVTGSSSSTKPKTTTGNATLASGKTLTSGQSLTAGTYRLAMQKNGNLVEYQGTKVRWASGTTGHSGAGVVMQKTGNLAIFSHGKAVWSTKTAGHAGAHLTLQAKDGNVVIYGPGGRALWATGT